jgi:biofilm PGA synthesis protein PgaA
MERPVNDRRAPGWAAPQTRRTRIQTRSVFAPDFHRAGLGVTMAAALGAAGATRAQTPPPQPMTVAELLARAQSKAAAGKRIDALADCQEVLAREPGDQEAQALDFRLLADLGASTRAIEILGGSPPDFVVGDYNAHEVRWTEGQPADPHHPYVGIDHAVADIRKQTDNPKTSPDARRRGRLDLLVGLEQADEAKLVLTNYAALVRDGIKVPTYAKRVVADAYMQRRRPREAIVLYKEVIAASPAHDDDADIDATIGLAYAYLEAGQPRQARKTIDGLNAHEARWQRSRASGDRLENPRKVRADSTSAAIWQYAGYAAAANRRFAALSAEAPGAAELHRQLAMSDLARGWPRAAVRQLNIADTLDETDADAALNEVDAHRALFDFRNAEADLALAVDEAGRSARVQDAVASWRRFSGWQVDVTNTDGWGSSPQFGDRDSETEAVIASPLIDDHWRMLAIGTYADAAIPEGKVEHSDLGLGVEGYFHAFEGHFTFAPSLDPYVRRPDLTAGFDWALSDYWSWSVDADSGSDDAPLRARFHHISGDQVSTAVQWRRSDLLAVRASAFVDHYSDGNIRTGAGATVTTRLLTLDNLTWDGGAELDGSHNTEANRPYFNPSADLSAVVTSTFQDDLAAYEDRSWTQRIDLAAGSYSERDYGTGALFSLRYGQTLQPRAGARFGWGLTWRTQPYDGRREERVVLDLNLHWGE